MRTMIDGIDITLNESMEPRRVLWVVLKGNTVHGSGVEYAPSVAVQTALDVSDQRTPMCARQRLAG
jgi:hypothetical protein